MKRHLKLSLIILALTGCFTSCLKDEQTTVLYSSQEIPDINYFMPTTLLNLMGNSCLHFGDEPPRLSGCYYADSLFIEHAVFIDTTLDHHSINLGLQPYQAYFNFYDQHKGIIKCDYTSPRKQYGFDIVEYSREDSTHLRIKENDTPLTESPYKPTYFNEPQLKLEDFNRAYIMGEGDNFTLYYYEMLINHTPSGTPFTTSNFYPIVANIISGRIDTRNVIQYDSLHMPTDTVREQIIKDFYWGKEVLGYFSNGTSLQQMIDAGYQPTIGDTWYLNNSGKDVYLKDCEVDF